MNELVTLQKPTALAVFTAENPEEGVDPILQQIREAIDTFEPDVNTNKGRKEIASLAYKIAQSKSHLEGIGKELAAEYKRIPALIDDNRKRVRDTLDKWRDEVRAPLTHWESEERARVQQLQSDLSRIKHVGENAAQNWMSIHSEDLAKSLDEIRATAMGEVWQEFVAEAASAKDVAIDNLESALSKRLAYEEEQAELERLRKEAEEREALEREQEAKREQEEREQRIAREAAEQAKAEAAAAERAERERAEAERLMAIQEKEEAERRAKEAEERAVREKQQAIEAERKRIAAEKAEEERLERQREEDKAHRSKINNQAKQGFIAGGLSEQQARLAVTLIAKGNIAHVQMRY